MVRENPMVDHARKAAFHILLTFDHANAGRLHVEDMLESAFAKSEWSSQDRAFTSALTYGVLRSWFLLNQLMQTLSQIPLKKLSPQVRTLLRIGLYQLTSMDKVPDYAAVSSTLSLAQKLKQPPKAHGFLSALLQRTVREKLTLCDAASDAVPPWFWQRLVGQLGEDKARQVVEAQQQPAPISIRVNTLKTSLEALQAAFLEADITLTQSSLLPDIFHVSASAGSPRNWPGYNDGWFMVQDESSAQVVPFLDPPAGARILEIGAAPGGKTTHLAAYTQNKAQVTAVECDEKRLTRLQANLDRAGATGVVVLHANASQLSVEDPRLEGAGFDAALIDAPCSGTGTIRKHPELLLQLDEREFAGLIETQQRLLLSIVPLIKTDGIIVYSTCSIDHEENQSIIARVLATMPDTLVLEEERLILPSSQNDGFYMARLRKIGA